MAQYLCMKSKREKREDQTQSDHFRSLCNFLRLSRKGNHLVLKSESVRTEIKSDNIFCTSMKKIHGNFVLFLFFFILGAANAY